MQGNKVSKPAKGGGVSYFKVSFVKIFFIKRMVIGAEIFKTIIP